MRGFDLAAYETLHNGRKSIEQISQKTGITKSSLYRYSLPMNSSGLDIPTRKLSPIMKAAGIYKMLHLVAADCGFLCVKQPRSPQNKADENGLICQLQKNTAYATVKAMEFFEKQTIETMNESMAALDGAAAAAVSLKWVISRYNQLELAF